MHRIRNKCSREAQTLLKTAELKPTPKKKKEKSLPLMESASPGYRHNKDGTKKKQNQIHTMLQWYFCNTMQILNN